MMSTLSSTSHTQHIISLGLTQISFRQMQQIFDTVYHVPCFPGQVSEIILYVIAL